MDYDNVQKVIVAVDLKVILCAGVVMVIVVCHLTSVLQICGDRSSKFLNDLICEGSLHKTGMLVEPN